MAQNNPEFNEINYGLLEDFNEENNTLTNESLYESALDTNNLAMNIENLRRDTDDISEQSDTALRRESTSSRKRKDNIMNTNKIFWINLNFIISPHIKLKNRSISSKPNRIS